MRKLLLACLIIVIISLCLVCADDYKLATVESPDYSRGYEQDTNATNMQCYDLGYAQSYAQDANLTACWQQLYLDFLRSNQILNNGDPYNAQLMALQDYDLDGIPEMLLGSQYIDTSEAFFDGQLFTVQNGELAQYHSTDGSNVIHFANLLLNAKPSREFGSERLSWVYHMPRSNVTAANAWECCGNYAFDRDTLLIDNITHYSLMVSLEDEQIQTVPDVDSIDAWNALRDVFLAKFNAVTEQPCRCYQIRSEDASLDPDVNHPLYTDIVIDALNSWQPSPQLQEAATVPSTQEATLMPLLSSPLGIRSIQSQQTYSNVAGYDTGNLTDGKTNTCWTFDRTAYTDITQVSLTIALRDSSSTVTGMRIANGYWKSTDRYYNYSRIAELRLAFFSANGNPVGQDETVSLFDSGIDTWQGCFFTPKKEVAKIVITMLGVIAGDDVSSKNRQTRFPAISELEILGE